MFTSNISNMDNINRALAENEMHDLMSSNIEKLLLSNLTNVLMLFHDETNELLRDCTVTMNKFLKSTMLLKTGLLSETGRILPQCCQRDIYSLRTLLTFS